MPAAAAKKTKAATPKATATKARTVPKARTAPAAAKAPQPRAAAAATKTSKTAQVRGAASKTADLSQDVFTQVEAGQRTALAAVRKFVDTVDEAMPVGGHPSRRETVIDAALDMADKLVTTQYHFLRSVVRSADRTLRLSDAKKK